MKNTWTCPGDIGEHIPQECWDESESIEKDEVTEKERSDFYIRWAKKMDLKMNRMSCIFHLECDWGEEDTAYLYEMSDEELNWTCLRQVILTYD